MKIPSLDSELNAIDHLIRDGLGGEAVDRLQKILSQKVPREHAAQVAQCCWRASLPSQGAKLLVRYVRPTGKTAVQATPAEKLEYAACLIKLGALEEARELLEEIPAEENPRQYLYVAFCDVAQWDYGASIAPLKKYLASPKIDAYQRWVGEVNLGVAYVEERDHLKASVLLRKLLHDLSLQKYQLLLGRVLLASAENFIWQQNWKDAEEFLGRAEKLLEKTNSLDLFLIRKFRAVVSFLSDSNSTDSLRKLQAIRDGANKRGHWETARDCDRIEAIHKGDWELCQKLYFGTPFPIFRKRMLEQFSGTRKIPSQYEWVLCAGKNGVLVDLVSGKKLKSGQILHRLLLVLSSDFYRPIRTAAIHSALYPNEFYNPLTSPVRVRQLIKRLRQWFPKKRIPLSIEEDEGTYRLSAKRPCQILVSLERATDSRERILIEELKKNLTEKTFSITDAAKAWKISNRSALRTISIALEQGWIAKIGKKKGVRYSFS